MNVTSVNIADLNPAGAKTPRWGMAIDLNRCVGCQTCTIACKHANDTTPGVQWRSVLDVETGTFPDVQRLFMVVGCQHCAEPPCVPVCPTGATKQRADGLVTMDYDVCIGCAYCAVSCPYQARTIVHEAEGYYGRKTMQERATAHPERLGVAQKCTFCGDRVDAGIAQGLKPGVDPDATPACAASCVAQAIHFGDYADPSSNVSRLTAENEHFQMHAHLGTDPHIKYLYTTPAVPGRDVSAADVDDERMSDPANPLVGKLQTFWDLRAALNWIFGGMSSGLAFVAGVGAALGLVDPLKLPIVLVLASMLMVIGLVSVFLKIGRQARFWRAFARPHTSWMTRELYAVVVFYAAVLASLVWWAHPVALAVATLAAGAFLVCQAQILYRARGIPAWRAPLVPTLVIASGLYEGFGVFVLTQATRPLGGGWLIAGILLAGANAYLWHRFLATARDEGIPPLARAALERVRTPVHVIGHIAPIVALVIAAVITGLAPLAVAFAGLAAIGAGALWKLTLIVRAGYQQGFALAKLPQRGSGARAAPARFDGVTPARR